MYICICIHYIYIYITYIIYTYIHSYRAKGDRCVAIYNLCCVLFLGRRRLHQKRYNPIVSSFRKRSKNMYHPRFVFTMMADCFVCEMNMRLFFYRSHQTFLWPLLVCDFIWHLTFYPLHSPTISVHDCFWSHCIHFTSHFASISSNGQPKHLLLTSWYFLFDAFRIRSQRCSAIFDKVAGSIYKRLICKGNYKVSETGYTNLEAHVSTTSITAFDENMSDVIEKTTFNLVTYRYSLKRKQIFG